MADKLDERAIDRRGALECMVWAGTGLLWTFAGGVPKVSQILGVTPASAQAATGFTFVQISDSHVGFDKPANPNRARHAAGSDRQGQCGRRQKPAFMIHTGDISPSVEAQGNSTTPTRSSARRGSTCITCRASTTCSTRIMARPTWTATASGAKGAGWYSFDHQRRAFRRPRQCRRSQGRRHGQSRRRAARMARRRSARQDRRPRRSWCSPISRCGRSIRIGAGAPTTARRRLACLKRFGSVTVLNGHIHQIMQKVEGNVTFHTARSTAFPQPAPGTAPSPGPMKVPDDKLRTVLGVASISVKRGTAALAITDAPLA